MWGQESKQVEESKKPLLERMGSRDSISWREPSSDGISNELFCFVLVFKIPGASLSLDEKVFNKKLESKFKKERKARHPELMKAMWHKDDEDAKNNIQCEETLKSAQNACIEMFGSFFTSMFEDFADETPDSHFLVFQAVEKSELYMCVQLGDKTAEKMADVADYRLQLHNSVHTYEFLGINFSEEEREQIVPAYVRFDAFMNEYNLMAKRKRSDMPGEFILRRVDMIRLLYDKINHYIDLPEMERMGLVSSFPSHNENTLEILKKGWANFSPRVVFSLNQPIDQLRDYFGEQVTFYFVFLKFSTEALLVLSAVALPMRVVYYMAPEDGLIQQLIHTLYCLALVMLYAVGVKLWKRTEAYYVNLWGMDQRPSHHEMREPLNPNFEGEKQPWELDEKIKVVMPIKRKYIIGRCLSVFFTFLYLSAIYVCVSMTQYYVAKADAAGNVNAHRYGAGAVSAQIKIFSLIWRYVAPIVTEWEQHPTMSGLDQSIAFKVYTVDFFNTFFPFFYIAFLMPLVENRRDAWQLLKINIEICYLMYLLFGVLDLVLPYMIFSYRVWNQEKDVSFLEKQSKMQTYTGSTLSADFLQVIFPLAFVALFSSVLPIGACALAIINLKLQRQVDAWKLCYTYRRTFPVMVDGIGVWNDILFRLGWWSLLANLLLIFSRVDVPRFLAFSPGLQEVVSQCPITLKVAFFFGIANIFFIGWVVFNACVPDMTAGTQLSMRRQEYQMDRLRQTKSNHKERITCWCKGQCNNDKFDEIEHLPSREQSRLPGAVWLQQGFLCHRKCEQEGGL